MMRLDTEEFGVMINRTRVASLLAAFALLSMCAAADARGGGGGGGRGASSHGGAHGFASRAGGRIAPGARHGVARRGILPRHDGRHVRRDGFDFRRHHGNRFDRRDMAGRNVYYGGVVGDDYATPGAYPAYGPSVAPSADDDRASGPLCRSADQVVPRERGGQTLVTVTRCYPPNE